MPSRMDELLAIARGLRQAGCGVIEAVGDFVDLDAEFELLRKNIMRWEREDEAEGE